MGVDQRMFIKIKRSIKPAEVRAKAVAMTTAIGTEPFWISRPGAQYGPKSGVHALSIVKEIDQDSAEEPNITPIDGETFICVNISGRYYGIGYERGPLPTYLTIARYLRHAFMPCEIWYGGDSSGTVFERLDGELEEELWAHFCSAAGRDYFTRDRRLGGGHSDHGQRCGFCQIPLSESGGGGTVTFLYCNGCGWQVNYDRSTRQLTEVADHFDQSNSNRKAIAKTDLEDHLLRAVAAMSLDETRVIDGRWSGAHRQRQLTMTIETDWQALSKEERAQAFERILERLAERSRLELVGGPDEAVAESAARAQKATKRRSGGAR